MGTSAKQIFEHGFRSQDKHNPGMQAIIDTDSDLGGTFLSVTCSAAVQERALQSLLRDSMRWMVRDVPKLDEPP